MAQTKNEVAVSVTNQQALVQRLLGNSRPKATKMLIPGGRYLLDQVSQPKLEEAVYTWLRRHRWYEYAKISFASNPETMDLQVLKVQDFPAEDKYAIWEQPSHGKRWLATQMSTILARQKLVYIEAKKDGLYVATEKTESDFGPTSENWEPYIELLPIRRGEYAVHK